MCSLFNFFSIALKTSWETGCETNSLRERPYLNVYPNPSALTPYSIGSVGKHVNSLAKTSESQNQIETSKLPQKGVWHRGRSPKRRIGTRADTTVQRSTNKCLNVRTSQHLFTCWFNRHIHGVTPYKMSIPSFLLHGCSQPSHSWVSQQCAECMSSNLHKCIMQTE